MIKNMILRITLILLVVSLFCSAATIQFIGPATNINDGSSYVGPYNLTINGEFTLATCITYNIEITQGETWIATETPIVDFSMPIQKQYLETEWLNEQFMNSSDWVGIQHAIWDIIEPATFTDSDTQLWLNQAVVGYGSVDPNSFMVLIPNPVTAAQTFLIPKSPTPELSSLILCGSGIILIFLGKIKRG